MRGGGLAFLVALLAGCSALILDEDLDSDSLPTTTAAGTEDDTSSSESGPVPHPLDGSAEVDCADAEVSSSCSWEVESTVQACELNCQLHASCGVLEVDYDHDLQAYVEPVDMGTLACILDGLGASAPAYFEWREHGTGDVETSEVIYRAWLLRPEELILARWHESSVDGNIGEYGQELTAVSFDATELTDCQAETQGVDRYACLINHLRDAGCFGFGPASCD